MLLQISVHMCVSEVLEYFLCMTGNTAETWSNCNLRSDGGKLRLWFRACSGCVQAHTARKKRGYQTRNVDLFCCKWINLTNPNAPTVCLTWSHCQAEILSQSFGTSETACLLCEIRFIPRRVDPVPWQCTLTHSTFRQIVFGEEIHRNPGTLLLLTRSRSVWLFPLPTMNSHSEGSHFETWKGFRKLWHQSKQLVKETYGSASTVENNARIYV